MKFKYLLPLLIPTLAITTIPFYTSCTHGESETDILMDLYAKNKNSTPEDKTQNEYFDNWKNTANKNLVVEYSIFSFILINGFTLIDTGPTGTDVALQPGDSLFSLCSGNDPILIPLLNSNHSNKVTLLSGNNYSIQYIGALSFQLLKDYAFTNCPCARGDILQFAFDIPNAIFNKGCVTSITTPGLWIENYDYTGILGNSVGIVQIQRNNQPFAFYSFLKDDANSLIYNNYFNYTHAS